MDIAAWLQSLGLERYQQAFIDHAIDGDVLADLTDADLEELGVLLGHRKRLLRATAALRDDSGSPVSADVRRLSPGERAERRQLTVMFVDLVGSTALSGQLDPEEMRDVLRAYQNVVAGEVARFEGHVAKFMGDGVLAYFGWPKAQEDEAERAVRAGLAVAEAVARLEPAAGARLAVRTGIATGVVIVGELIGEGSAQEETVVGETPNLAARLQAWALPGQVVVAESTRRLIGSLFELEAIGPSPLRGFAQNVLAFRVLGPGRAEGRFEGLHADGLTPLAGRDHELALLIDRWRQAREGRGQVVLLGGEPGIGKSRLVQALRERLGGEALTLRYHCSPYHTNSALWPVINQLERAAGCSPHDSPETKLDKLGVLLGQARSEAMPFLAEMLSLPAREPYPGPELTPQQRKLRLFRALLAELEELAQRQPVLIVLEDVHWIDATTTELFDLTIDRLERLPVLLVVTFRPEFQPPWTTRPHTTLLTLGRLGTRQSTAIVDHVAGGKALPAELLDQILARTDGVPLFVEELTKAVLELGLLTERGERYVLAGPMPGMAIPSTLHGSLLARLDRLAPVKEVAQIGAVIGREFAHELLAAVAPLPRAELAQALEELVAAELVIRRSAPSEETYVFKHALVQEVAYASLLKSRRQQIHARVAKVLEEQFPETVAARPELLAHHCTEAGLIDKAAEHWWQAGCAALARSAPAEACGHLRQALNLLRLLPDDDARAARELEIRTALGGALIAGTAGYAASEAGETYDRARALCERLGRTERLPPLTFGQWAFHLTRGELGTAGELAEKARDLAERRGDAGGLSVAHRLIGVAALWRGRPEPARAHLETALALHDPARDRHSALLYAWDQRVTALVCLALALWQLGYPEQALARSEEGLAAAEELGHTATLAHALHHSCMVRELLGDIHAAGAQATRLEELCTGQRLRYPSWLTMATLLRGADLVAGPCPPSRLADVHRCLASYRATGSRLLLPYWLALEARALAEAERGPEALATLGEALQWVERTEQRWMEAELHRVKGRVLLRLRSKADAETEAAFRTAVTVARRQKARMWELRAARDLARLWAERGERRKALDLLAPVHGWFSEGAGMTDLEEAEALLASLR